MPTRPRHDYETCLIMFVLTQATVTQTRPRLNAAWLNSKKEKLTTMHFRDWSKLSLFPGVNSSNPTTILQGDAGVAGDRRHATVYKACNDADVANMLANVLPGSNKSQAQGLPSLSCKGSAKR